MILEQVGDEDNSPIPAYPRVSKLAAPAQYDGEDNESAFNVWFNGILEFCRKLQLCGDIYDTERKNILSTALKGKAAEWYFHQAKSTLRMNDYWTFEEAVVQLYRRFVVTDAFQQASFKFYRIHYTSKGGIAKLNKELEFWSQRMYDQLLESIMKERLITNLPKEMEQTLFISWGLLHPVLPHRIPDRTSTYLAALTCGPY